MCGDLAGTCQPRCQGRWERRPPLSHTAPCCALRGSQLQLLPVVRVFLEQLPRRALFRHDPTLSGRCQDPVLQRTNPPRPPASERPQGIWTQVHVTRGSIYDGCARSTKVTM